MKEKVNILIIDDNSDLADNLKDILENEGYGIKVAADGKSAIRICSNHTFDLALVDLKLPDIHGIDLIKKLSKKGRLTEFIIITAHGTLDIAAEAVTRKDILAFEMKPLDIDRLITLIQQVSKRKHAEAALEKIEARYRRLVEGSVTGIYIVLNNELKFCNQRFADIFGYNNPDELLGKKIEILASGKDWEKVEEGVSGGAGNDISASHYEFIGKKKDGTRVYLEVLGTPIDYEGEPAIQGTLLDITDRKVAERELKKHQEQLENIVQVRTSELEKKNAELQRMNKLFVGREFRIKELRNTLKELQNRK